MRNKLKILIVALFLATVGGLGWWIWHSDRHDVFQILLVREEMATPDIKRYGVLMAELKRWQTDLAKEYEKAESDKRRNAVEKDAKLILEMILPEMMRCWKGTGYDFNGTANGPGKGKIACGYFVSTVLRDAGFKLDRFKLAQQPSQNILRSFLDEGECELRVGENYSEYVDWLESKENGVYIIGLDTHVGFIVLRSHEMRFLHSSGINSAGVVEEGAEEAQALKKSNWRMLGNISGDQDVIKTWLVSKRVKIAE